MTSLTELCAVCFQNPPKYTCPRCGCQTCGLDCVRTHKKRAKCSGIRNPATYKKSCELATPASIDQDYNFITKVQRDIEKAEDNVAGRGITLQPARNGINAHSSKSKLEAEYETCGVTVIKAPTGLTRSKQNKTRWDGRHKCIMWTIEWVLQDNTPVFANVQGGRTVLEAFANTVGKKALPQKRKLEESPQCEHDRPNKHTMLQTAIQQGNPTAQKPMEVELQNDLQDAPTQEDGHEAREQSQNTQKSQEVPSMQTAHRTNTVDNIASQTHFYLHRPRTSSKWTCLIPILPSSSISDVLRDRALLEFPTIHARHETPDQLIPPFVTEKDYEKQHGIEVATKMPVYGQEIHTTAIEDLLDHIDERKVLEVLQKDLVG